VHAGGGVVVTLVEFLLARVAEDEQAAQGATLGRTSWRFENMQIWSGPTTRAPSSGDVLIVKHTWPQEAEHIIRHDPARVLAECRARRAVIELHGLFMAWGRTPVCRECGPDEDVEFQVEVHGRGWPCRTLRALALPFKAHPDFSPGWLQD
jgi:hypothetical protein